MRGNPLALNTFTSAQQSPAPQAKPAQPNAIGISLMLLLPAVLICIAVGCRKRRATVRQQQIQLLNQLWQLDSGKKLS
jgi:hypothetical protein